MAINLSQFITGTFAAASSGNVVFSSAVSSASLMVAHIGFFNGGALTFTSLLDNVNANNYTIGVNSTMTSDTQAHLIIGYKAGISSGAAGSTYRVSANFSGAVDFSIGAVEYTGGPWLVGSTASANGTSTLAQPGQTTASSTPQVFVTCATVNSSAQFRSTVITGTWLATIDTGNTQQILNFGHSTNSSLAQNPQHQFTASTRWIAASMIFMGAGAGSATRPFVDGFTIFGCV